MNQGINIVVNQRFAFKIFLMALLMLTSGCGEPKNVSRLEIYSNISNKQFCILEPVYSVDFGPRTGNWPNKVTKMLIYRRNAESLFRSLENAGVDISNVHIDQLLRGTSFTVEGIWRKKAQEFMDAFGDQIKVVAFLSIDGSEYLVDVSALFVLPTQTGSEKITLDSQLVEKC